jgi:hypothetical protein
MIKIYSNDKKLLNLYKPQIFLAVKKYHLQNVSLSFFISNKIYGGRISPKNLNTMLENKKFVGRCRIYFGKPQTKNPIWPKALVFHELGHLISFAVINSTKNVKVKVISSGFAVEPLSSSNIWWTPWLEVVAEFLSCKFGGKDVKELVLKRRFKYWKWWKSVEAFALAKKYIIELIKETKNKNVTSSLYFALNEKLHRKKGVELYRLMTSK